MNRLLLGIIFTLFGVLLVLILMFGMVGIWHSFLSISLEPLQTWGQSAAGLILGSCVCFIIGGALLKNK